MAKLSAGVGGPAAGRIPSGKIRSPKTAASKIPQKPKPKPTPNAFKATAVKKPSRRTGVPGASTKKVVRSQITAKASWGNTLSPNGSRAR